MIDNKYKIIDLFSGMGGIRRGFELAGCQCVLSAEINKYAIKQYKHMFDDDCFNDVTTREFKDKCKAVDYDILCGGFPCQTFSTAGSRMGFLDKTKGTLFFDCAKIIQETRPKAFLLENVQGLLTHDYGKTFNIIFQTLTDLNYKLVGFNELQQLVGCVGYEEGKKIIRNTKDFGLPQNRPRVFIVGFDRERYGDMLRDLYELPSGRSDIYTLDQVLSVDKDIQKEDFVPISCIRTVRERERKYNTLFFDNQIVTNKGFVCTLNTRYNSSRFTSPMVLCDKSPSGYRYITVNEGAMLQGFKGYGFMENGVDKFSWDAELSRCQKGFLLGNSVSIPVIECIANFIREELERLDKESDNE